jgi:predicted anti-sigma-YlaC factor YlaD
MLTCRELTELVTDYLDGHLSLVERLRFEMHLGICSHCRAYLRQMKQTIRALGTLREEDIPDDVSQRLLARFQSWKK